MKEKRNLKVGDKVFYFDGQNTFSIETAIKAKGDLLTLSNNATVRSTIKNDGSLYKVDDNGKSPRTNSILLYLTPEVENTFNAIQAHKRISNLVFQIQMDILRRVDLKQWQTWPEDIKSKLVRINKYLTKALKE
jgi:hypothetical protein